MITAENITPEQIRELLRTAPLTTHDRAEGVIALIHPDSVEYAPHAVRAARARCAEILNARAKEQL